MKFLKILLLHLWLMPLAALAHGDEDHGAEAAATSPETGYFSAEKSSAKYEVLIKHGEIKPGKEAHLTLFLSDVITNKPISDAKLGISNPGVKQQFDIGKIEAGIYELHTVFDKAGSHKLNIKIDGSLGADLLQVAGIEAGKQLAGVPVEEAHGIHMWQVALFVAFALVIGISIGLFLNRRSQLGRKTGALLLIISIQLWPVQNLVLAHGGEDHGDAPAGSTGAATSALMVPKETQFLFDVWTEKIGKNAFSPAVSLFGTVIPTSSGKAVVQSPFTGVIRSLNVNVGQQVGKGQLLAVVEQNIDAATQVSWATERNTLNAEVQAAKKELDRLKSISDIVAKREIDEAERRYQTALDNKAAFDRLYSGNKQNSKFISLFSPIAGKIENFNFSIGSTVSAGQDIFTITNVTKVYVEAQVFDKDVDFVNRGKEFIVECTNDDHKTREVRLVTTAQSLNTTNQSQRVRFEMDNPGNDFKIGEFVNVRVYTGENTNTIALPNSAITEINGKPAVFIKQAAEKYDVHYVATGENNGEYTTITRGLEEADRVVVNGTYQMKMMYFNQ